MLSDIGFDLARAVPRVAIRDGPEAMTLPLVGLFQQQNYRNRLFLFKQRHSTNTLNIRLYFSQGSKNQNLADMLHIFKKLLPFSLRAISRH